MVLGIMREELDKCELYGILIGTELFLTKLDSSWPGFVPLLG
jgi:hypothetical protein